MAGTGGAAASHPVGPLGSTLAVGPEGGRVLPLACESRRAEGYKTQTKPRESASKGFFNERSEPRAGVPRPWVDVHVHSVRGAVRHPGQTNLTSLGHRCI
jgi:hypothetical protein